MRCDYLSIPSVETPRDSLPVAGSSHSPLAYGHSPIPNDAQSVISNADHQPGLNLLHLELLHNFTTSTSFTLNNEPTLKTLWRINVVQVAFGYEFVMNAILALSALHLAHFRPGKAPFYFTQARLLHQNGLRVAAAMLTQVDDENCSAIYIFTALTSIITLASPRDPGDILLVKDSGIAEWLTMFRGTRSIIMNSGHILHNGVLGPMFKAGERRAAFRDVQPTEHHIEEDMLKDLQYLISRHSTNEKELEVYTESIEELRKSFLVVYAEGFQSYDSADVYIWLFRIKEEYLLLLQQKRQEALAIFAFYCVILKRFEGAWWMKGWTTHLMTRIYALLDEQHRSWVRWPIEETGWVLDQ